MCNTKAEEYKIYVLEDRTRTINLVDDHVYGGQIVFSHIDHANATESLLGHKSCSNLRKKRGSHPTKLGKNQLFEPQGSLTGQYWSQLGERRGGSSRAIRRSEHSESHTSEYCVYLLGGRGRPHRIMFHVEQSVTDQSMNNTSVIDVIEHNGLELEQNASICKQCSTDGRTYTTTGDSMVIVFQYQPVNWTLYFSVFHDSYLCRSYEYSCTNHRCIFFTLSCNGHDPCGDQSDCRISIPAIATLALGGFCALGVVCLLLYICMKSRLSSSWSSWDRQPRSFSPAKALLSIQSFTPATVTITPVQRRWSYKY
ncbi:hypothetical protein DPMN_170070 [Dreissena polymorpha]|uniref:CUB domain-containing protein n=2 Tax=Dreissena polymorpha TaxID=45954 RepID=A0A9D4DYU6_DREPO|nr:hypothetical protein DPMN_170070 [Dreissena polymorpha]